MCTCGRARGIVLLEAIVAIGILALITSALLVLAARSTAAMYSATDRLIASYLVYDGADWLRAKRDLNVGVGGSWYDGIGPTECPGGNQCGLETSGSLAAETLEQCTFLNNCVLSRSTAESFYRHIVTGAVETPFTRTITLDPVDFDGDMQPDEISYTIRVEWRGSGGVREGVEVLTTLYDPAE